MRLNPVKNVFLVHFQNACFALYILSHNTKTMPTNEEIFGCLNFLGPDLYFVGCMLIM